RHPRRPRRIAGGRGVAGRGLSGKVGDLRQYRGPRADGDARLVPAGRRAGRLGDPARAVGRFGPAATLRLARRVATGAVPGLSAFHARRPDRAGQSRRHGAARRARRHRGQGAVPLQRRALLLQQSDRALFGRDGGMFGDRRRARSHDGGGIKGATMAAFFFDYIWPVVIMLAESVLLLLILLMVIAYMIYA